MIKLKVKHMNGKTELLNFDMLNIEEVPTKYIKLKNIGDTCCYGCEQNKVIEIREKNHKNEYITSFRIGEVVSTPWFKEKFIPLIKISAKRLTEINKCTIETIHI